MIGTTKDLWLREIYRGQPGYKAIGNFIYFFPEHPFFGTGTMTDEIRVASKAVGSSQIHVGYLSFLVYFGIFGCFFLFGSWFLLSRKLLNTAQLTNYWGSFFGFLTFLWSFATMNLSFIFFYGITFCLVFDKYFHDKFLHKSLIEQTDPPNPILI